MFFYKTPMIGQNPIELKPQLDYLENGIDICCGLTNYFNSKGKYILVQVRQRI